MKISPTKAVSTPITNLRPHHLGWLEGAPKRNGRLEMGFHWVAFFPTPEIKWKLTINFFYWIRLKFPTLSIIEPCNGRMSDPAFRKGVLKNDANLEDSYQIYT